MGDFNDLEDGDRFGRVNRQGSATSERRRHARINGVVAAPFRPDRPALTVDAQPTPAALRILAKARVAWSLPSGQRGLLRVKAPFRVARPVPEHTEPRPKVRCRGTHPQVRPSPGRVMERDEGIVVHLGARATPIGLGVDARHGSEEGQGLVDEVGPEIEEDAAGLFGRTTLAKPGLDLRAPALEARFESSHGPQRAFFDELPDREVVAVPAAVLEDG